MNNKKIFISHSHKDVFYAKKIIKILEKIGVGSSKIFCSSVHGYGVPLGEDFLSEIKKWLGEDVIVIFLLSKKYYESPISLCEMGASWITAKKVIPILIPPLTFKDFAGVFNHTIGLYINDIHGLTLLKETIETLFDIRPIPVIHWEVFKDNLLKELKEEINSAKDLEKIEIAAKINKVNRSQLKKDAFNIGYSCLMIIVSENRTTWRNVLQELCGKFDISILIDQTDTSILNETIEAIAGKILVRYGEDILIYLQISYSTIVLMSNLQNGKKINIEEYLGILKEIPELKDKTEAFRELWSSITYDIEGMQKLLDWLNEIKKIIDNEK